MCNTCIPILVGVASPVLELKFDETSLLSPISTPILTYYMYMYFHVF